MLCILDKHDVHIGGCATKTNVMCILNKRAVRIGTARVVHVHKCGVLDKCVTRV